MANQEILKTLPTSNDDFRIDIIKTSYAHSGMENSWNICASLISRDPENKYGLYSVTLSNGYDNNPKPSEKEAVEMIETYLSKKGSFEDAVKKMVDRWAEQSFSKIFNQNNGDTGPNGGMSFALTNLLSARAQENITEEKIDIWKNHLTEAMISGEVRNLYTDYAPDFIIQNACEAAGISIDCIPIKSSGNIDRISNVARVSFGYHGKQELL